MNWNNSRFVMWLMIHVDAISAFKDIKDHIEMQRLLWLCLLYFIDLLHHWKCISYLCIFFVNENEVVRDRWIIISIGLIACQCYFCHQDFFFFFFYALSFFFIYTELGSISFKPISVFFITSIIITLFLP